MDASTILRRVRAELGISRASLARLTTLSPSTVGRIEMGTLDPTWGTLRRVLESAGFQLHGEDVVPVGDASAVAAARIALDQVLSASLPAPGPEVEHRSATDPAAVQVWLERWRRAGWIASRLSTVELATMAVAAATISKGARPAVPRLAVGERRNWREIALQIGDAGIDYAVSGLIAPRADPSTPACTTPTIYVRDPSAVAARLGWGDSEAEEPMYLVGTDGLELEGIVVDGSIPFTSPAQALMDGLTGSGRERSTARVELQYMLIGCMLASRRRTDADGTPRLWRTP